MISLNISLPQLQMFFFMFLRIAAILLTIPVFESRSIPHVFKLGLAFTISLVLFPMLNLNAMPALNSVFELGIGAAREVLLGLVIGFSVKLLFAGVKIAGQLAGYQMGMAITNVMDPDSSQQVPLLAQFNNLFALLVFITVNAHYWFIKALVQNYRLVPPLTANFGNSLTEQLIQLSGNMFVIAIQVGAPIIAALLITSVGFGLIARTVSQMNVFIVAMPLKIGVGLLFIGFSLPYLSVFLQKMFSGLGQHLLILLKAMS